MEQMNGSPLLLLPIGRVGVMVVGSVVGSVVFSFVSPWGAVVGVNADVVVGLALVTSVSPLVVGVVVVVQVVPELVETVVSRPLETSCSFVSPCCSCTVVGGLLPVGPVAGISIKYPSTIRREMKSSMDFGSCTFFSSILAKISVLLNGHSSSTAA